MAGCGASAVWAMGCTETPMPSAGCSAGTDGRLRCPEILAVCLNIQRGVVFGLTPDCLMPGAFEIVGGHVRSRTSGVGARSRKRTWLYVVGVPDALVRAGIQTGGVVTHWVSGCRSGSKRSPKCRPFLADRRGRRGWWDGYSRHGSSSCHLHRWDDSGDWMCDLHDECGSPDFWRYSRRWRVASHRCRHEAR